MALEFSTVRIATPLVPLAEMMEHLGDLDPANELAVTRYSAAAQAVVLAYLTTGADAAWTDATVPDEVRSAIKLYAAHLYEHRGDDMDANGKPDPAVWAAIANLLAFHRDPTLA